MNKKIYIQPNILSFYINVEELLVGSVTSTAQGISNGGASSAGDNEDVGADVHTRFDYMNEDYNLW